MPLSVIASYTDALGPQMLPTDPSNTITVKLSTDALGTVAVESQQRTEG